MIEQQSEYAKKQVEARWQMVNHLKKLLAALKPKLSNLEFDKVCICVAYFSYYSVKKCINKLRYDHCRPKSFCGIPMNLRSRT